MADSLLHEGFGVGLFLWMIVCAAVAIHMGRQVRDGLTREQMGWLGAAVFFAGCFADSDPQRESLWVAHLDDQARCLHVSRHEEGHRRLSNHVQHRANIWALRELGADCAVATTVCGAVDTSVPLGSLWAGWLARRLGVVPVMGVSSAACLVMAAVVAISGALRGAEPCPRAAHAATSG